MSSQKYNNNLQLPRDNYVIRCTEESFGPSKSSGNPMATLNFEIDSPEEVEIAGVRYTVAGARVSPVYLSTLGKNESGEVDADKTAKSRERFVAMLTNFGLPTDNINWDNPTLGFKGKLVHALLYSDESEQRKTPTKEQMARGQQGDILLHPITKVPLVKYYPKVDTIFGLAEVAANKAF